MSSKRDLVEAHSFNRRRLVTAFLSGAPGGREVEPVRPGRTLVGGLVLAVLLVAGAGIAGFLAPALPEDWAEHGLVVGKETGARYVALEGELYPVINTTSARLVLGDAEVTFAPEDRIAEQNPGVTIGIPGAPDAIPAPADLIQSGWTSCVTPDGRVKTSVLTEPRAAAVEEQAVVVQSGGTTYVVAAGGDGTTATRHPVPRRFEDSVRRSLGLDGQTVRTVPGVWLDLFPLGSPLAPFSVDGSGGPVPSGLGVPSAASRVGSTLVVDGRAFLVAEDGLVGLSDVDRAVYAAGPGADLPEVEVSASDVAGIPDSGQEPAPDDWPDRVESFVPPAGDTTGAVCGGLTTDDSGDAAVWLGAPTAPEAAPGPEDEERTVEVENGHGALIQGIGGQVANRGAIYVVDASGTRYPVGGDLAETLSSLGFEGVPAVDVPLLWVDLLPEGPELSRDLAWRRASAR